MKNNTTQTNLFDISPKSFPSNPLTVWEIERREHETKKEIERRKNWSEDRHESERLDSMAGNITPDYEFNDSITGARFA